MRKAVPSPSFVTRRHCSPCRREDWERKIDSFDRAMRRSNRKFNTYVCRIDHSCVGIINSERKLPADMFRRIIPDMEG